ncbi:mechanosensitive ion channel family protein [Agilicoccus flavus]|uniref:mechanosensitive ion channel family protein n=1 Tax=Agilicoccus flavus TaxID=2775968 RepID=UPI001CF6D79C|nr:mechanosensitive ion channel family protein [Agilicoccus flavus]
MTWLSSFLESTAGALTGDTSSAAAARAARSGTATLTWEQAGAWFLDRPLNIVIIVLFAFILRWLVHRAINTLVHTLVERRTSGADTASIAVIDPIPTMQLPVMKRSARRAARALSKSGLVDTERQRQRVTTLGSVLKSVATVVIWTIAVLMIGQELGLNMAPVLASAGVGGVALGFGAQSLVKDFLSGVFMILEDQYGVGDIVDTGEVTGYVEEVSLRVTRLRDMSGIVWYVRNGEIVRIANKSQGWQVGSVDVPVAIDEDPERVIDILEQVVADVDDDPKFSDALLEAPTVAGVDSMSGGTMTIKIFAKCAPNEHWAVQREILERAKIALAKAGVRGPIIAAGAAAFDPIQPTTSKPANPSQT